LSAQEDWQPNVPTLLQGHEKQVGLVTGEEQLEEIELSAKTPGQSIKLVVGQFVPHPHPENDGVTNQNPNTRNILEVAAINAIANKIHATMFCNLCPANTFFALNTLDKAKQIWLTTTNET